LSPGQEEIVSCGDVEVVSLPVNTGSLKIVLGSSLSVSRLTSSHCI